VTTESRLKGVRVRCPLGGLAPCVDDMCHSGDRTLCGLFWGEDFCEHDYDPETCPLCDQEREYEGEDDGDL